MFTSADDEVVADIDTADTAQSHDVTSGPLMTALAAVNPASESTQMEGSDSGGTMATTVGVREGESLKVEVVGLEARSKVEDNV